MCLSVGNFATTSLTDPDCREFNDCCGRGPAASVQPTSCRALNRTARSNLLLKWCAHPHSIAFDQLPHLLHRISFSHNLVIIASSHFSLPTLFRIMHNSSNSINKPVVSKIRIVITEQQRDYVTGRAISSGQSFSNEAELHFRTNND